MARTKRPMYGPDGFGPLEPREASPPPPNDWRMDQIRRRVVNQEAPFALNDLRNTEIPWQVVEMGWHRLVGKKPQANLNVVQEFYHAIDITTCKTAGVLVQGVGVQFNPRVLNLYYGLPDFSNHQLGFPLTEAYDDDDLPEWVAVQLRQFPRGPWGGLGQHINHIELFILMVVWNVFISHTISPIDQHQIVRNDHPMILHAINYGEKFDVSVVMCRALELNVRSGHFLVLPCTITSICAAAGVNMRRPGNVHIPLARSIESRIWNRLANDRGYPNLDEIVHSKDEQVAGGDDPDEGDDNGGVDEAVGGGSGGPGPGAINLIIREIRTTRQHLDSRLRQMENSLRRLTRRVNRVDRPARRDNPHTDED